MTALKLNYASYIKR